MANEPVALTVKEAAAKARVGVDFFYRLLRTKDAPPIKRLGDRILIPARTFYLWLETPTKPRKGKRNA
ncbi:MAG: helix-turn-helix domain-containing protein [Hyphomicrobium sp.]|jgi:excisionase family DNA binding protein